VAYHSGVLKAVGYNLGKLVNSSELKTASRPTQIKLTPDRKRIAADGQDLGYITVELVDERGVRNPVSEDLIKFSITGPGSIVGVGNANPTSTESYQQPQRKAWQGRCLLIIKSSKQPGPITITASSRGLTPAKLVLNTIVQ
jgi:beta-galactosidase